jgi:hypothetical protein
MCSSLGVIRTIGPVERLQSINTSFVHVTIEERASKRYTILIMKVSYLPEEAASVYDIMVEFIPPRQSSEFRTGDFRKRMKVQSVDTTDDQVH